jgi:hypothetical protein
VPSIWQAYEQLVAGQRDHFRVEKRFFRADGEVVWTNLTVSLVRDERGTPTYQIAMMEDIGERRRLQASMGWLFAPPAAADRIDVAIRDQLAAPSAPSGAGLIRVQRAAAANSASMAG